MQELTLDQIVQAYCEGAVVVTPNRALANRLIKHLLKDQNKKVLPGSRIFSLQQWLELTLVPDDLLILAREHQLIWLWEKLIESQAKHSDLHPPSLAPTAVQGWRNLKLWRVDLKVLRQAESNQMMRFSHWLENFNKELQKRNLTTLEILAEKALLDSTKKDYPPIVLVDFAEPPAPLWMALMNHYSDSVKLGKGPLQNAQCFLHKAPSLENEMLAATHWASAQLKSEPGARVAIISTQYQEYLHPLTRMLSDRQIQFGCRRNATDFGIIHAALNLLEINRIELDLASARNLVQNPFWGDYPNDLDQRSHWEERICNMGQRVLTQSNLLWAFEGSAPISELLQNRYRQPKHQPAAAWAQVFQQQLVHLGWPGQRQLNQEQSQALDIWPDILGDFCQLGVVCGDLTASDAIRLLVRLCQSHTLALNPSAPVQVLDRVEAAANYSHVWLLGADDQEWPRSLSPHPLIPVSIQQSYGMPRVSVDHELDLCRNLIIGLQHHTDRLVFSFASDTEQTRVAPLVNSTPNLQPLIFNPPASQEITGAEFDWVDCRKAPALTPDQCQVRGGSGLLQTMAASPFDAFAMYRLYANPLEEPTEGLDPRALGSLIHDMLDRAWRTIDSQEKLQMLEDNGDLEPFCDDQANQATSQMRGAARFGPRYRQILAQQMAEILQGWLKLELQRGSFDLIATEDVREFSIGPLHLNLRIDRIDRIPEGLLLIDYKSGGSGSIRDWQVSPPTQPQLPLYALVLEAEAVGIAFASLKSGQMGWTSMGTGRYLPKMTVVENWAEQINQWRSDLIKLAEDFAGGATEVHATQSNFFSDDPLLSLHRFPEHIELPRCRKID